MPDSNFTFSGSKKILPDGRVTWQAPSNIALVKYWGKHVLQLPKNPSISFTLSQCATTTTLSYKPQTKETTEIDFTIYVEGKQAKHFRTKIATFFQRIWKYAPFIMDYEFRIDTRNSFPHSSGIASSASGMAALALCIMQMEANLNPDIEEDYFYQKASFLARLGSGSAARSIKGPVMTWGAHPNIPNSTDEYALGNALKLASVFENYQDSILLVDKGKKEVSSSLGHDLMNDHPFAEARFKQATHHTKKLLHILKKGALDEFVKLVESEALSLHAMMMTSHPYFLLMKANTLKIIRQVWAFRETTQSHLCFTLDAGANVHLLYPEKEKEMVLDFIEKELTVYCHEGAYIKDQMGLGAQKIEEE